MSLLAWSLLPKPYALTKKHKLNCKYGIQYNSFYSRQAKRLLELSCALSIREYVAYSLLLVSTTKKASTV